MTFVSHAQNYEDVMLWRALGDVGPGFYIDLGAFDAETDSVTLAFYDRGWRGINVEPAPAACARIRAARPRDVTLNVAVGRAPGRAAFHVAQEEAGGLSTMEAGAAARFEGLGVTSEVIEVEVVTLASICAAHVTGEVHFLKIDVEGAERAVLEGADFRRWRPWVMLLEATAPMSTEEVHGEWEALVLAAGYRFVWFDGLNRFYVAAEREAALARHFRTPPNVFDGFVRRDATDAGRRLAELSKHVLEVQALSDRRAGLIGEQEAALGRLRAALTAAEREAAAARAQAEAAARALVAAEQARVAAEEAAARAVKAGDAAVERLAAMERSTSWRLTAPLRRLRGG